MKKILLIFFLVGALLAWYYTRYPLTSAVIINGQKIFVEMAVTETERRNGLSNRASIPPDHGMLFLMGEPAYHGFWMKDMKFPLDFIWIKEKTVVDVTENVPNPVGDEQPESLKPRSPADKILEVNAGTVAAYQISVGDMVSFKN